MMSQSSLPTERWLLTESQTRVDSPMRRRCRHCQSTVLPTELLEAIAGQDSEQATLQLRRQALELAGLLREKQRSLDHRESELNARTALLENEIRSSRLKQQHRVLRRVCHCGPDEQPRPTLSEALAAGHEAVGREAPRPIDRWAVGSCGCPRGLAPPIRSQSTRYRLAFHCPRR